jgi:hypothetical protein
MSENKCNNCNKTGEGANPLKKCAGCNDLAWYCSVECQKADWDSHKVDCLKSGCSQLFEAIQNDDAQEVKRWAKNSRTLNGRIDYQENLRKWSALHECVRKNKTKMIKILIKHGAKLEIKDGDGETATFVASTGRCPELIKILLDAGANPNARASDGWTCVMMAARDGDYETTRALLEAGADVHAGRDMFGRGVLDIAAGQATSGQGVRMREGEPYAEAIARSKEVHALLSQYA